MLKTKLSGLICYELSEQIEKVFEIKTAVTECGDYTALETLAELTESGSFEVKKFIEAFEYGVNGIAPLLDEIQKHAELIISKINQM